MKRKTVTVKLDPSTYRWLAALARANSGTELNPREITPATLLAQAAFCMADYAGRRDGSWEAHSGYQVLIPSGYQATLSAAEHDRLLKWEEQRRQAWLAKKEAA